MADNTTNFDIKFKTSADLSGAEALNKSLGISTTRERELADMRKQFLSAADAEVAKVNALADAAMKRAEAERALAATIDDSIKRTLARGPLLQEKTPAAVNPWASTGGRAAITNYEQYRRTLVAATDAQEKLGSSQGKVAGSSANMGNALLQGSRALQDLQYGIGGVVNNLEGIASAMGLGAGVAGAVTVLAVAVQTLGPAFAKWFATLDKEGAKLEVLKNAHLGIAEAIKASFNPAEEAATKASEAFTEQLRKETKATDANKAAIDAEVAAMRLRNQIKDTSEEYQQRMQIEAVRASKLSPEETAKQEAAIQLKFTQAKAQRAEELARQEEAAQLLKITEEEKLARSLEQQLAEQERIRGNAKVVQELTNPENPGSIVGLQTKLRDLLSKRTQTENEFGAQSASAFDSEIESVKQAITQRQSMLGEFAGKLPGGVLDVSGTEQGKAANEAVLAQQAAQIAQLKEAAKAQREKVTGSVSDFERAAPIRDLQSQQRAQQLEGAQRDILGRAGLNPAVVPSMAPRLPWELPGLPGALPGLPAGQRPLGLNDSAAFPPLDSVRAPAQPPAAFGSGGDIKAQGDKAAGAITDMAAEFLKALQGVQDAATKATQQIKNSSGRSGS